MISFPADNTKGISWETYPVLMDLLEVFVDGIVARPHGDSWEGQVEQHQCQHVGHVVPGDAM